MSDKRCTNRATMEELCAHYPIPVFVSPDRTLLAVKWRHERGYEVGVVRLAGGEVIARTRAGQTQLLIGWRPDSRALAFVILSAKGEYELYLWEFWDGNAAVPLGISVGRRAVWPLRWRPDGAQMACRIGQHVYSFPVGDAAGALNRRIGLAHPEADYRWLPGGAALSGVSYLQPSAVTLVEGTRITRITVLTDGMVQGLAWDAEAGSFLAAGITRKGDYSIVRGSPEGRMSELARGRCRLEQPGFLEGGEPFWHEVRDGLRRPIVDCRPVHALDRTEQAEILRISGQMPSDVLMKVDRPDFASRIECFNFKAGTRSVVWEKATPASVKPVAIELESEGGVRIPAFFWRSASARSAVVVADGGPHLHVPPLWDPVVAALTRRRIAVLAVNYRGSSGFGSDFERLGNDAARSLDVVQGVRFLVAEGFPGNRIAIFGRSYGAHLACLAATALSMPLLFLLSVASRTVPGQCEGARVYGFHGLRDPLHSAEDARAKLAACFGPEAMQPPRGIWTVLDDEGHTFHSPSSWERVVSAIDAELGETGTRICAS